jgi:transcriptional regulatory protein LEU3
LELHCVVDKSYKRTSRRSKIEELAAELQTIKEAVAPSRPPLISVPPELPPVRPVPVQIPSSNYLPAPSNLFNRLRPYPLQSETPATTPGVVRINDGTLPPGQMALPAEPRALGSRVFSGEEINYYFDKYFEHFHPYLPIVRTRDPDICYKRGHVLFWAIIMTACRRFARDDTVFQFLIDSLLPEIWSSVSQPPLRLPIINSLLLLATWPFPTIRFLSDPSIIFAGIAMNSSFLAGLPTGQTQPPPLSRVTAYMGCPSAPALFNKTIDSLLDSSNATPIPRYFAIHLETSRFSSRVARTMCASLEEAQGVSHHLVAQMEDEYTKVQRALYPDNADLDTLTILSTQLEIQTYYFMPLPNHSPSLLQRNLLKTYTTAEAIIHVATNLHRTTSFLSYAPHFVFRTLLSSICVIMSVHLSSPHPESQFDAIDPLVKEALIAMRICSVQDGDLHIRVTNMIEKYWNLRANLPRSDAAKDAGVSEYTHRLGASLTFACLRRWRKDVELTRDASTPGPAAQGLELPREYFSMVLGLRWELIRARTTSGGAEAGAGCRCGCGSGDAGSLS